MADRGPAVRDRGFKMDSLMRSRFSIRLSPRSKWPSWATNSVSQALKHDPASLSPELRQNLLLTTWRTSTPGTSQVRPISRSSDVTERPGRSGRRDHRHEGAATTPSGFRLAAGAYDAPGEPVNAKYSGGSASFCRRLATEPAGTGPLADRPQATADGAGDRQSLVAVDLRPGIVVTPKTSAARTVALASRAARLAARHFIDSGCDVKDLWREIVTSDLPASIGGFRRSCLLEVPMTPARSRATAAASRRDDPRYCAGGERLLAGKLAGRRSSLISRQGSGKRKRISPMCRRG